MGLTVRTLGCSGAIAAGCKTTSFLLDDDVLIDAGTGVNDLTFETLAGIDHVLLSHSHLDHVLSVPLLADTGLRLRMAQGRPPVTVHALPQTLKAVHEHLLNGVIWPDFTRLPSAERPALRLQPIAVGEVLVVGSRRRHIEVLNAEHIVPGVGFAVDGGSAGWWVYSGDTGPNPLLWQRLRNMQVSHLVIETAFGDDEAELARISRHLCPKLLGEELRQLAGCVDVHITHVKPGEMDLIMAQIGRLGLPHRVSALAAGDLMRLD